MTFFQTKQDLPDQNLPNQTYCIKNNSHTYQTEPAIPNLPNRTENSDVKTKPTNHFFMKGR